MEVTGGTTMSADALVPARGANDVVDSAAEGDLLRTPPPCGNGAIKPSESLPPPTVPTPELPPDSTTSDSPTGELNRVSGAKADVTPPVEDAPSSTSDRSSPTPKSELPSSTGEPPLVASFAPISAPTDIPEPVITSPAPKPPKRPVRSLQNLDSIVRKLSCVADTGRAVQKTETSWPKPAPPSSPTASLQTPVVTVNSTPTPSTNGESTRVLDLTTKTREDGGAVKAVRWGIMKKGGAKEGRKKAPPAPAISTFVSPPPSHILAPDFPPIQLLRIPQYVPQSQTDPKVRSEIRMIGLTGGATIVSQNPLMAPDVDKPYDKRFEVRPTALVNPFSDDPSSRGPLAAVDSFNSSQTPWLPKGSDLLDDKTRFAMSVGGVKKKRAQRTQTGVSHYHKLASSLVTTAASSTPFPPPPVHMAPPSVTGAAKRKRQVKTPNISIGLPPLFSQAPSFSQQTVQIQSDGPGKQINQMINHPPSDFSMANVLGGSGGAVSYATADQRTLNVPKTDPAVIDRLKRLGTVIEVEEDSIPSEKIPPGAPSALKMLEKMTIDPPQSPVVSALDDRPLYLSKDVSVFPKKKTSSFTQPKNPLLSIIPLPLPPAKPVEQPPVKAQIAEPPTTPSVPHLPLLTITKAAPRTPPLVGKITVPSTSASPVPIITVTKTASSLTSKPPEVQNVEVADTEPSADTEPPLILLEPVIVIDEDESPLSSDGKFIFKADSTISMELLPNQKVFSCDICSAAFHHLHMLRKHYFRLHIARKYISEKDLEAYNIDPEKSEDCNDEFIYRCHTCRQCLPTKTELKSHLTDHPPIADLTKHIKGAKDYKCERCGATFKWRKMYGKHKRACKVATVVDQPAKPRAEPAKEPVTLVTELALRQVIDTRAVRNSTRAQKTVERHKPRRKTRRSVAMAIHSPPQTPKEDEGQVEQTMVSNELPAVNGCDVTLNVTESPIAASEDAVEPTATEDTLPEPCSQTETVEATSNETEIVELTEEAATVVTVVADASVNVTVADTPADDTAAAVVAEDVPAAVDVPETDPSCEATVVNDTALAASNLEGAPEEQLIVPVGADVAESAMSSLSEAPVAMEAPVSTLSLSNDKIDLKTLAHCLYCNETFANGIKKRNHSLSTHSHSKKNHKCIFCSETAETYPTTTALFSHLLAAHQNVYFACQSCKERFHCLEDLKDHSTKKHTLNSDELKALNNRISEVVEETSSFVCSACLRIWLFKSCFLKHKCNPDKDRLPNSDKTGRLPKLRKVKVVGIERTDKSLRVDPETMFFSQVSLNVRNNLLHFLDGKLPQDEDENDLEDEDEKVPERNTMNFSAGFSGTGLTLIPEPEPYSRVKAQWEKYNFPKNYDGRCGLTSYIKDMSYLDLSTQLIMRRNLQRLQGNAGVTSPDAGDDVPSVLALERLATQCAESYGSAGGDSEAQSLGELSGEWVRDRVYICSVCSWGTPCLWTMEDHKYEVHPQVLCPQHELVGDQRSLADTIYKRVIDDAESPFCPERPHLRPPPINKIPCTKCGVDGFASRAEIHVHILACAGEPIPHWAPTPRKRRWPKKRRRPRRGLKRNIPSTPHRPVKVRTKPGDTDTIQKMIANLPAKRSTRRVIGFDDDPKTRSQSTIQNCPVLLPSSRLVLPPSNSGHNKAPKSLKSPPKAPKELILAPPLPRETDLIDTSAERGDVLSSLRMMPVSTPREELLEPRQIIDKVLIQKVLGQSTDGPSSHPCTGCGQTSDSRNALRKHQKNCAYFRECGPNAEHKCKTCARLFDNLVALIEHSCDEMPKLEIEQDLSPVNLVDIPVLSPVRADKESPAKFDRSLPTEIGVAVDGEMLRKRSHSMGDLPTGKVFRSGHRRSARLGNVDFDAAKPDGAATDDDNYESAPEPHSAPSKHKKLTSRSERPKELTPTSLLEVKALAELRTSAESPSVSSDFMDDDSVWEKQSVVAVEKEVKIDVVERPKVKRAKRRALFSIKKKKKIPKGKLTKTQRINEKPKQLEITENVSSVENTELIDVDVKIEENDKVDVVEKTEINLVDSSAKQDQVKVNSTKQAAKKTKAKRAKKILKVKLSLNPPKLAPSAVVGDQIEPVSCSNDSKDVEIEEVEGKKMEESGKVEQIANLESSSEGIEKIDLGKDSVAEDVDEGGGGEVDSAEETRVVDVNEKKIDHLDSIIELVASGDLAYEPKTVETTSTEDEESTEAQKVEIKTKKRGERVKKKMTKALKKVKTLKKGAVETKPPVRRKNELERLFDDDVARLLVDEKRGKRSSVKCEEEKNKDKDVVKKDDEEISPVEVLTTEIAVNEEPKDILTEGIRPEIFFNGSVDVTDVKDDADEIVPKSESASEPSPKPASRPFGNKLLSGRLPSAGKAAALLSRRPVPTVEPPVETKKRKIFNAGSKTPPIRRTTRSNSTETKEPDPYDYNDEDEIVPFQEPRYKPYSPPKPVLYPPPVKRRVRKRESTPDTTTIVVQAEVHPEPPPRRRFDETTTVTKRKSPLPDPNVNAKKKIKMNNFYDDIDVLDDESEIEPERISKLEVLPKIEDADEIESAVVKEPPDDERSRLASPPRGVSPSTSPALSPDRVASPARMAPLRSYGRPKAPSPPSDDPPELVDESKVTVDDESSPLLPSTTAEAFDPEPPALEPTGDICCLTKDSPSMSEETETQVDTEEDTDSQKSVKCVTKKKVKDMKLLKKKQLFRMKALRNKKKKELKKNVMSTSVKEVVKVAGISWEVSDFQSSPTKADPLPTASPPPVLPNLVKDWDAGDLWDAPIVPSTAIPVPVASGSDAGAPPLSNVPGPRSVRSDSGSTTGAISSLGSILDSVNKLLNEPDSNFSSLPSHYSLADLQKAMGASDAEMAVLQQLGEVQEFDDRSTVSQLHCEDEWGPLLMDLDNQAAQQPIVSSSVAESSVEGPTETNNFPPQSNSPVSTTPVNAPTRYQDLTGFIKNSSMCRSLRLSPKCSSTSLLAAHTNKEVVCPTCSCHFMGFPALQIHVDKVHGSTPDPAQVTGGLQNRRVVLESAKNSSRLVCFECQQILPSHLLYRHLEVEHGLGPSNITKCSTVTGDPHEGPVGGERLKSKMSSALGDLFDKAVANLLTAKAKPETGLSGGAMELLSRLCSVRKRDTSRINSKDLSFNKLKSDIKPDDDWSRPPPASKPYLCSVCGQRFSIAASRNKHEVLAHRSYGQAEEVVVKEEFFDDDDWRDAPSPEESNVDDATGALTLTCSDCGLSFESMPDLMKHRVEDHAPRRRQSTASETNKETAPVTSSTALSSLKSTSRRQSLDTNLVADSDDNCSTSAAKHTESSSSAGASSTPTSSPPAKRRARSRASKVTGHVKAKAEAALRQLNISQKMHDISTPTILPSDDPLT